jgi:FtsH-binding integral membrane protein
MKDFDSLLNIWNEQKMSPALDYKEVLLRFKKSRNKFTAKIWLELIWMVLAALVLIYIWFNMNFFFWTTHVSLLMFVACCMVYIYTQIVNLRTLGNDSFMETPEKHILHIENFRKSRYKQNTRIYYFYTLAMGIALGFYFIEFFNHVSTLVLVSSITFSVVWFAICTFFIRKLYMKKEEKRFNEMLTELERLKKQFTEFQ